jgi:penicillin amidase
VNQLKGEGNFLTPQKLRMILSKIIHNALNKYDSLDSIALADLVWGKVHKTNPIHPLSKLFPEYSEYLNPPSVSFGGDSDTPQQGGYIENLEVNSISVNRYVHDVSDWNNSRWIVPLGSSGNPGSKHYSDQTQMWADLETIPQLWDWDTIQQSCESRQLLIPYPKK